MEDTNDKLARGMRVLALVTFLAGTAIFMAWYYLGDKILLIGYGYIVVAALVNLSLAVVGLTIGIKDRNRNLVLSAGTMLLNIPATFFYAWLTLSLIDTARITLTNDTGADLVDLKLTGCEEYVIPELEAGESETVWIKIPNDCSVELSYVLNGQKRGGDISGYLTPGMGGAMDYNIGGLNDPDEHIR